MNKESVRKFFNTLAPTWDVGMVHNDAVINTILDNAGVSEGKKILDVACGTGVLINDYLDRKVASVTGIDICEKMISVAQSKFNEPKVTFICEDADTYDFKESFDAIVIYNAFPHFSDAQKLIEHLAGYLNKGGVLTVAHGMSREKINKHHEHCAKEVSCGLMTNQELEAIFAQYLEVTVSISNDDMYQVAGRKI